MLKLPSLYRVLASVFFTVNFISCLEDLDKIHFTNSWAVHIENGSDKIANEIAEKHGFNNFGQIGSLPGYFHFVHKRVKGRRRHRRDILDNQTFTLLSDDEKVKWVEQQHVLERDKRNVVPEYVPVVHPEGYTIRDPLFSEQWYLNNVGQASGPSTLDINVLPVWSRGISGKNIVVAILDDGLDHTHPDLRRNYDPVASYDFIGYDEDPMPRDSDPNNCHGTKCAGEVAAEAGNGVCGVGVAFNCSIAGIRMLDGNVTDTIEGSALSHKNDYIDVYSCAWGPKDDGKRFGRPGTLASKALELGVKEGRNGLGNIFVWATGNGGLTDDDCNCDGYTTSVYTVSIGAISDHGLSTYYTESCSSTLAVTFSGGSHREKKENKIITTTLNHQCTDEFKGTSSAAPLAAGMVALMLEANSKLTWRDVQHVIVETTLMTSPLDEGWRRNGAGKWFNQKFGFGKLDASALVERARNWTNVPEQQVCWGDSGVGPWDIPSSGTLLVAMNNSVCEDTKSVIRKVEHVQVVITLKHRHRGHLSMELISPTGTRTRLLKTRRNDKSTKGLKDWVFMSVHFWGEDPRGLWTLSVTDNEHNNRQHHRNISRFGDTEDATEVLQDEMNGKDRGEEKDGYKSSEEFEDNVFKDGSFKEKRKRRKHNNKQHQGRADDSLNILRRKKMKAARAREKNAQVLHQGRIKGPSRLKGKKKDDKEIRVEDSRDGEEEAEQKILEELLGTKQQTSDLEKTTKTASLLNATRESSGGQLSNDSSNPGSTKLKNNTQVVSHSNQTLNATPENGDNTLPKVSDSTESTDVSTKNGETESETKMLENLLRGVISQVFSNFLSKDSKPGTSTFEDRISTLEGLLGKKGGGEDDKMTAGLMKAFKSGKAIDRVNNVLNILQDSKNNTQFTNTSFSRNADVVVDVLKVLKDVLNTGKDNKGLKGYKTRIANLLEKQTGNTQKLTGKLLSDLKSSGSDRTNSDEVAGDVVNDALTLISRIFQSEKSKSSEIKKKNSKQQPKKYRIMFEGPNNRKIELPYSSIKNVFASADGSKKEITKTSSSKEIHQDNDDVEKITVEHVTTRKASGRNKPTKKKHSSDKISSALRHAVETESNFENILDTDSEGNTRTSIGDGKESDDFSDDGTDSRSNNGLFTMTIMKNGEEIEKKKVNDVQVMKMLRNSNNPQLLSDLKIADKKDDIKPTEQRQIDVEVIVENDGKKNVIDSAQGRETVSDHYHDHENSKTKSIKLSLNEDLVPKSVTYDLARKKTNVGGQHVNSKKKIEKAKKHSKNMNSKKAVSFRKKNSTESQGDTNDYEQEENQMPFYPYNDNNNNEPSFSPALPGMMSGAFIPSFSPNNFPNFEYPFSSYPSSYANDEKASFMGNKYPAVNSFETPLRNPTYDVAKRSDMSYGGYRTPFRYFYYPSPPVPQHIRTYRSVYDDGEGDNDDRDQYDNSDESLTPLLKRSKRNSEIDDEEEMNAGHSSDDDNNEFRRSVLNRYRKDDENDDETDRASEDFSTPAKTTVASTDEQKDDRVDDDSSDTFNKQHTHRRRRRSIDSGTDELNSRTLIRQKRSDDDLDDDVVENDDGEDHGPHVVKRSAIFSDFYPSRQPSLSRHEEVDSHGDVMTKAEKRSAIRKALVLERTLKQKLYSMKKESSSALDIIKRVHEDIANSDSRDLRVLEKELSNMNSGAPVSSSAPPVPIETTPNIDLTEEEPIHNFIKLVAQTENSSQRKVIPDDGGKQNPEEYYKYGTTSSGILISWTLKFHGTNT